MNTSTDHGIVPILCFHHISDLEYYTAISRARFVELLLRLKEKFTLIDSSDLGRTAFRTFTRPPLLLTFDDAYEDNIDPLLEAADSFGCKGIIFPVANYIGKHNDWNVKAHYRARHASRSHLKDLLDAGYQIGSHTLDHINLVRLEHVQMQAQIKDSRQRLEDILQTRIEAISYPFGWFNREVAEMSSEYYRLGFSTLSKGGVSCWGKNPYAIGRLSVGLTASIDQIIVGVENWSITELDEMAGYSEQP